jgi:hypothetical protein
MSTADQYAQKVLAYQAYRGQHQDFHDEIKQKDAQKKVKIKESQEEIYNNILKEREKMFKEEAVAVGPSFD